MSLTTLTLEAEVLVKIAIQEKLEKYRKDPVHYKREIKVLEGVTLNKL